MKKEVKLKTRYHASEKSQFLPEVTLGEVIRAKINYVIDQMEIHPPHYHWYSKNSIVINDKFFNSVPKDDLLLSKKLFGFYKDPGHADGSMPSISVREEQMEDYGYCMSWWPPGVGDMIQDAFREIEDKINDSDSRITLTPCRGYIDKKTGELKDAPWNHSESFGGQRISGYVICREDDEAVPIINEYLNDPETPWYIKAQFLRAKRTGPEIRLGIKNAAITRKRKASLRMKQSTTALNRLTTNIEEPDWKALGESTEED